jgi:hypothetical protein
MFKKEQLNKLHEQGLLEGLLNTLVDKIKGINDAELDRIFSKKDQKIADALKKLKKNPRAERARIEKALGL